MSSVESSQTPPFKDELQQLLNKHGMDARVEMPDFFLAEFLTQVLVDMEHMNRGYRRWREQA